LGKRQEWLECIICGQGFKPFNQVQLTCSKKCSKEAATNRTAKWRIENEISPTPSIVTCKNCEKEFKPSNLVHLFCSPACAKISRTKQIKVWQKTKGRNSRLLRKYGLDEKEFDEMAKNQNYCCMICKKECENLCVDHDHDTGKVRELLCVQCNAVLGIFKEDITIFENAIAYITKHKE